MSADIAIRVEHLSKRYLIGHEAAGQRQETLRDAVTRNVRQIGATAMQMARGDQLVQGEVEEFWALTDVSFEVPRGQVVGIIGRNGAGKSTLLKILSRITEPTKGRVVIHGRVSSLLEVGTGFHPELTGRENIFLNGAILGMGRSEIRSKFDEIVEFAEIERFLDTPVKRYSSGMYVRLAFAVAAHMEPEILIVDEVLAVGDLEFQKKCLGKMSEVAGGGRTVLFVSHNEAAVQALCSQAIYLIGGRLEAQGPANEVLSLYTSHRRAPSRDDPAQARTINDALRLEHVSVSPGTILTGAPVEIEMTFAAQAPGRLNDCALVLTSEHGVRAAVIDLREHGGAPYAFEAGAFTLRTRIASAPLVEGRYFIEAYVICGDFTGLVPELGELTVTAHPRRGEAIPYAPEFMGVVELDAKGELMTGTRG